MQPFGVPFCFWEIPTLKYIYTILNNTALNMIMYLLVHIFIQMQKKSDIGCALCNTTLMGDHMRYILNHMVTAKRKGLIQSAGNATPKQALADSLQKCGGLLGARSVGCLPKSRSQVRYHQLKSKQKSSASDPLFSVMLQCKSTDPNSDTAFVQSVVAAPEPMAVLALNHQLNDMVRFLTDPNQHSIMGIDPTFNFDDFNVTPIVFRYLLLEHRKQGHLPIILGPLLVHQQKNFVHTIFLLLLS